MAAMNVSRQVCAVGIGTSAEFAPVLDKAPIRLQIEAFKAALADAGLTREDVDGYASANGSPGGVDFDEFAIQAGCGFQWVVQNWSHGRWTATLVQQATLAICAGLANCVAILQTTTNGKGYGRFLRRLGEGGSKEPFRDVGGGHGEAGPYGLDTPGAATSLVAQRYGATSEHLAAVPLAFRKHAQLNPMALMRGRSLTLQEYLDSPPLSGPFRLFDYCLRNEGATCLILTSAERARDLKQKPVYVTGLQSMNSARDDFVLFSRPGLGLGFTPEFDYAPKRQRVYDMAGIGPEDVDALYMYDSFSSNLWMVAERFGFCKPGEAFEWTSGGRIELGGELPVNTNGGLLSEAHLSGHGHLMEIVRQLRGEAGQRQVPNAEVAQWATPWGDSVVFTRS
jgi:acetyl-CoA acetyltransferase